MIISLRVTRSWQKILMFIRYTRCAFINNDGIVLQEYEKLQVTQMYNELKLLKH